MSNFLNEPTYKSQKQNLKTILSKDVLDLESFKYIVHYKFKSFNDHDDHDKKIALNLVGQDLNKIINKDVLLYIFGFTNASMFSNYSRFSNEAQDIICEIIEDALEKATGNYYHLDHKVFINNFWRTFRNTACSEQLLSSFLEFVGCYNPDIFSVWAGRCQYYYSAYFDSDTFTRKINKLKLIYGL